MADGPKLTLAGKLFVLLFFAGCVYGAYRLLNLGSGPAKDANGKTPGVTSGSASVTPVGQSGSGAGEFSGPAVEIGMAYGTEKETWLKWATTKFAETPDGQKIKVKL